MFGTLLSRWNKENFGCFEANIEESEKASSLPNREFILYIITFPQLDGMWSCHNQLQEGTCIFINFIELALSYMTPNDL